MGYGGNLPDKYFPINFSLPWETWKFYPYAYRRVAKGVEIKCKNEN